MSCFAGRYSIPLFMSLALAMIAAVSVSAGTPATGSTGTIVSRPAASAAPVRTTSGMTTTVASAMASTTTGSGALPASSKSAGASPGITLSPYAEELARTIKFDRAVLVIIKEEVGERMQRLVGYDADDYQIMADGVVVAVPEDKTDLALANLRRKLIPHRYLPFVTEINSGLKMDKIGVLKTTEQYEILRIMHTDGDDYGLSNQDVIDQLREWEKSFAFDIVGADSDWVEIEFRTLPRDLKAFTREVYDFSPDAVDEGPGSIDGLVREIMKTNRLFLLWE